MTGTAPNCQVALRLLRSPTIRRGGCVALSNAKEHHKRTGARSRSRHAAAGHTIFLRTIASLR
jgi:hypothetical protein